MTLRDSDKDPVRATIAIEASDDTVTLDLTACVSHADKTILNVIVESVISL